MLKKSLSDTDADTDSPTICPDGRYLAGYPCIPRHQFMIVREIKHHVWCEGDVDITIHI